jgi:hypothetical protein
MVLKTLGLLKLRSFMEVDGTDQKVTISWDGAMDREGP